MFKPVVLKRAAMLGALAACGCGGVAAEGGDDEAISALQNELGVNSQQFFVPPPRREAVSQISALVKAHDLGNALKLAALVTTPQAVWFTEGTPKEVEKAVKKTMAQAALERRVPVLVAYNL